MANRGSTLRVIVWPDRMWALAFMSQSYRDECTAVAIRVLGEEKPKPKGHGGKRTRVRVLQKKGHRNTA